MDTLSAENAHKTRDVAPRSTFIPQTISGAGIKPSPAVLANLRSSAGSGRTARPKTPDPVLELVVDSREQRPLPIPPSAMMGGKIWEIRTETAALPVGDYSIRGWSGRSGEPKGFALERKSLADLVQSLSHGREGLLREMARARDYETFAVIVEDAALEDAARWRYTTNMTPASLLASIYSIQEKFRCPVLWFPTPDDAAIYAVNAARRFVTRKAAGPDARASPRA